jgi:putative zinc finger/helix-turn-helix YgiT family protein
MTSIKCPVCGKGELSAVTGSYSTQYLGRGEEPKPLQVDGVTWQKCAACGEELLDDSALSKIEAARYEADGLLSPSEIKGLRKRLGKTQTEMSALLGVGRKTYCRWESGSYRQNSASDRYLRLLIAEPNNVSLLEQMDEEEARLGLVRPPAAEVAAFAHLAVSDSLYEMEATFTELLSTGELHAVEEVLV